ncbi:short-chain dehydrogenase/reductase SDR [Mycena crocata]|nr:short-chain dehydrogenase/reductase SDR [Mycena crocata]
MVRSILVTGSNQGLGMHTVHQLSMTPDVLVFMGSRKIAAAEEALSKFASEIHPSSTVVPVQLDITDDGSIKAAHSFIADYLKSKGIPTLDVLVNNAALVKPTFKETYEVNVFGTVAITEAILPLLSKGGAILNISSGLGSITAHTKKPPPPLYPSYSSSKSALNALTAQWALQEEQKGSGIRVVSICPGHNATNLNNYTGLMSPSEGCKIIVKTALEKEGRTAVFFNKDKDLEW